MLAAYYTYCNEPLSAYQLDMLLYSLPQSMQAYIRKFRFAEDQYRSMYGRLLLKQALVENNIPLDSINNFSIDQYKRPHLINEHNFDFNISHSGDIVLCLVDTNANRIGVDIEEKKKINTTDYLTLWRSDEVKYLDAVADENQLDRFYQLWTQKEAVIKADGRGMTLPFNEIKIDQNSKIASVGEQHWHLYSLHLDKRYTSHIASLNQIDSVQTVYMSSRTFFESL